MEHSLEPKSGKGKKRKEPSINEEKEKRVWIEKEIVTWLQKCTKVKRLSAKHCELIKNRLDEQGDYEVTIDEIQQVRGRMTERERMKRLRKHEKKAREEEKVRAKEMEKQLQQLQDATNNQESVYKQQLEVEKKEKEEVVERAKKEEEKRRITEEELRRKEDELRELVQSLRETENEKMGLLGKMMALGEELRQQSEGSKTHEQELAKRVREEKESREEMDKLREEKDKMREKKIRMKKQLAEGKKKTMEKGRGEQEELKEAYEKLQKELEEKEDCWMLTIRTLKKKEEENDEMKQYLGKQRHEMKQKEKEWEKIKRALEVAEAMASESVEKLWIKTMWAIINTKKVKSSKERDTWNAIVQRVWDKNGIKDWRVRLTRSERSDFFLRTRGNNLVKDWEAYQHRPDDMWNFLRNLWAHQPGSGPTAGDSGWYNWVDRLWPWFWPAVSQMVETSGWHAEIGSATGMTTRLQEMINIYNDWDEVEETTESEMKLMTIIAKVGVSREFRTRETMRSWDRITKVGEERLARGLWEAINDQVKRRNRKEWASVWTTLAVGISERNRIKYWRGECSKEDEKIFTDQGRWLIGGDIEDTKDVLYVIWDRRGYHTEEAEKQAACWGHAWQVDNTRDVVEYWRWTKNKWPWMIAVWIGTMLITGWCPQEWEYIETTPCLKREWIVFMKWWNGEIAPKTG